VGQVSKILVVASMLLSGCVSPQPAGDVSALSVSSVQASPPELAQPVRWGGTITSIENTAAGSTVLEIVARPLNLIGRPLRNDISDGRFIAEVDSFLDPQIIKSGRDITVMGEVKNLRPGFVGNTEYAFPVVVVQNYRYWKRLPRKNASHLPHPGLHHHDRFWGDFWHNWPHAHHRDRRRTAVSARGIGIPDD